MLVRGHMLGNVGLQGRAGDPRAGTKNHDDINHPTLGREAVAEEGDDRGDKSNEHRFCFTPFGHDALHESGLNETGQNADRHEGKSDREGAPVVTMSRV